MGSPASTPSQNGFHIVGIGASAGGLEAFLELLAALPSDTGMAFVLIQHLEPHHESQLAEILSRSTTMPVIQAEEGQKVERNHVYVIPPNSVMVIQNGNLHLAPRADNARPNYSIDIFFESLAQDQGALAIGVVLSGSASDGSHGIRAIKARLGTTFAQEERSAGYGGMPHSAIATGAVDFVLPPKSIAEELAKIDSNPYLTASVEDLEQTIADTESDGEFQTILERLKTATHVDFSQYKQSTIRRRLGRRLVVNHLRTLREYLDFIGGHPSEIHDLYGDLLISVTAFFREPEMFEALEKVIQQQLAGRSEDEPFRMWVPGCATGEEAYSMAMIASDIARRSGKGYPVQVFGTDISEAAIEKARAGTYTEPLIQGISPERLQRFFTRVDSGYRIKQQVRDLCVFARHDLTADPPFSQMDVVSCRNVFIYLSAALQERVLPALHYSLKPSGLLVLGTAETVGLRSDLFAALDQENKIYAKRGLSTRLNLEPKLPRQREPAVPDSVFLRNVLPMPALLDVEARAARILRDLYAPAGVLVSEDMQILHVHGQTGFYLEPVSPATSLNLLRVAREDLLTPLRRAISTAVAQKQPVHEAGIQVRHEGRTREVTLNVIPLSDDTHSCLVLFEEEARHAGNGAAHEAGTEPSPAELQLGYAHREIAQTKDYLRKVIEQHDAATEELRAANEEARSSNEELQSTNEELRTAKEQLQSANEELTTVNDELQHRNRELSGASNDLSNILNAATVPICMVDMDLRLRRFTPAAERLLGLLATDVGRPVMDIRYAVQVDGLGEMLMETVRTLALQRRRVKDREGRLYDLYVRPYRTVDERIDGAVMTFIDVDEAARALQREETARHFADGIIETVQHPLLVLDSRLRVVRATAAFYKAFGIRAEHTIGRPISELGNGQWNAPDLQRLLEQALVHDVPFRDLEIVQDFPDIGRKVMRLNARRVPTLDQEFCVLLAIEDVTERLEIAEIQYRRLFESAKDGIIVLDAAGVVLDVNPYVVELFRFPHAELLHKRVSDLPIFAASESVRRMVADTLEKGAVRYDGMRLHGRDGRETIADVIANRYRVKAQPFIQLNIRDVTERVHDEERLRSANLDLQQFAFAASHDLQEPLRTITSYLELLKRDYQSTVGSEAEQHMGFVLTAADRMRHLVLDLLGYSQVVRADLRIAPVNVEAVLSMVLLNLQMAIQSSDARITFDHLPTVEMDETQLVQLLQNILSNAIKYRSAQSPRVHISARKVGSEWVFSIKDNGIGLDMRYADQIFAVFKRLHGRDYPGTGVGLAICKKIVERRGGRIWVESVPDQGSTFYFTVPVAPKQS